MYYEIFRNWINLFRFLWANRNRNLPYPKRKLFMGIIINPKHENKRLMKLEKFEKAKKVKEDIDRLERQKYKLESAIKSCSLGVTIGYSTGGSFPRKDEVSFYNKDVIKEMISKEIERLKEEIDLVKEEFENI